MNFEGLLNDLQDWGLNVKNKDMKAKSQISGKERLAGDKQPMGRSSASEILRNTAGNYNVLNQFSNDHMMEGPSVDAYSEKDLGNDFFKRKKFNEAIDCYSRSIALSPTAVAYANRAMAYLKIKRFREAEADCTEALDLDDRYVKAYSRRATAKKELGNLKKALDDVQFALRLEPNNQELKKQSSEIKSLIEEAILQKASATSQSSAQGVKISESKSDSNGHSKGIFPVPGKGKRGVSEITDSEVVSSKSPVNTEEIQTRTKTEERKTDQFCHSASIDRVQRSSHTRSKKSNKPELASSVHELASKVASQAMMKSMENISVPNSAYQFEISWRACCGDCLLQACLLKVIPPNMLPQIFKNALAAPMLVEIIKCLAYLFTDDMELVVKYLENLIKVSRFDMLIMCLPVAEKDDMRKIWNEVFLNEGTPAGYREVLDELQVKYCPPTLMSCSSWFTNHVVL